MGNRRRDDRARHLLAAAVVGATIVLVACWPSRAPPTALADDAAPKAALRQARAGRSRLPPTARSSSTGPSRTSRLLFTGEQDGFLEPCGCAGLQNQKGGLKRRHTLIKELAAKGWPVVPLDVGGLTKRYRHPGRVEVRLRAQGACQARLQGGRFRCERFAARHLEPRAQLERREESVRFGERRHSRFRSRVQPALQGHRSGRDEDRRHQRARERSRCPRSRTSAISRSSTPEEALAQVLPEAPARPAATTWCCCRLPIRRRRRNSPSGFPSSTLSSPRAVPTNRRASRRRSKARKSQLDRGRPQGDVCQSSSASTRTASRRFAIRRVPLDSRFTDSPEMQKIMVDYQHDLETLGLEGLGLKPSAHPTARQFAGSEACAGCHTAATEVFLKTPHSPCDADARRSRAAAAFRSGMP